NEVVLAVLEQQVVWVHPARLHRVAAHRVVVEEDRLAAEDRRLDLRQPLGQFAPAGSRRDAERHAAVLRRGERRRLAPRQLLQRQPQRLRVGELAVEQREQRAQGTQLLVGELDRREVEVLGWERIVLRLVVALGGLVDLQLDAQG